MIVSDCNRLHISQATRYLNLYHSAKSAVFFGLSRTKHKYNYFVKCKKDNWRMPDYLSASSTPEILFRVPSLRCAFNTRSFSRFLCDRILRNNGISKLSPIGLGHFKQLQVL